MNGHLISAMPVESDVENLSSPNHIPTEYLVKDNLRYHSLEVIIVLNKLYISISIKKVEIWEELKVIYVL